LQCVECNEKFCQQCRKDDNCPFCNCTQIETLIKLAERIKQLKSKCLGCGEQINFQDTNEHLNSCASLMIDCVGASEGCTWKESRGKMKIHEMKCRFVLKLKNSKLETQVRDVTEKNRILEIEKSQMIAKKKNFNIYTSTWFSTSNNSNGIFFNITSSVNGDARLFYEANLSKVFGL